MENSIARNPHLSDALSADYLALQNDLEQARGLAGDYQSQLSDKANDLAMLKIVLERTLTDLKNMQENILALRKERHCLANRAMEAVAFQAKLNTVTAERDQLKLENEALHKALERARAKPCTDVEKPKLPEAQPQPIPMKAQPPAPQPCIDIPYAESDEEIQIYPTPQENRFRKTG